MNRPGHQTEIARFWVSTMRPISSILSGKRAQEVFLEVSMILRVTSLQINGPKPRIIKLLLEERDTFTGFIVTKYEEGCIGLGGANPDITSQKAGELFH